MTVKNPPYERRHGARALVSIAAVLAAVLVDVAARIAGVEIRVPESPGSPSLVALEFVPVVAAAVAACLAGWLFLAVLERFTGKAPAIWTATALGVYLLTLPYMPGFRLIDRIMLIAMHSALAVVLILGLRRTMR